MTNYIYEKDFWQATISVEQEGPKQILNYILKRRCNNKTVFDSQERMARHFGVTTRTIRRWLKPWTDLLILNIRQRNLTTALYEVNPYLLKFSEKYKQIFPALKHFAENALAGIFKQNVLHNYNDINNSLPVEGADANNSSGSSCFSSFNLLNGRKEPTFSAKLIGSKKNTLTFGEAFCFEGQVAYESTIGSNLQHTFVNKLTEEEAEEIFGGHSFKEIELTIPELMEWYKENMKNLN